MSDKKFDCQVPEQIKHLKRPDGTTVYYAEFDFRKKSENDSKRDSKCDSEHNSEYDSLPVILIHGNGEDHASFSHQIDAFGKYSCSGCRVIAPDCRGRGLSEWGPSPLTLKILEDDVMAVLDAENITKCHLVGFSDGGNMALELVLRYPERFETLISVGANLFPSGVVAKYQIPTVFDYYKTKICSILHKNKPDGLEIDRKKQLLRLMVKEPSIRSGDLSRIRIPTLVIAGENDVIQKKHTELIANSIPGAVLLIISGGSHFVMMEMPDMFNEAAVGFLKQVSEKIEKRKYPSIRAETLSRNRIIPER